MQVQEVMTHTPGCLTADTTLVEAYAWLMAEGVRGAPVLDEEGGELIGVVSTSDLLAALASVLDPQGDVEAGALLEARDTLVRDLAEQPAVTCPASVELEEACRLMLKKRVRRLVVVTEGKVVGVLSATDVVYAYAREHQN